MANLRSKHEEEDDQLTELWSAIDLDEIMDHASAPNQAQTPHS